MQKISIISRRLLAFLLAAGLTATTLSTAASARETSFFEIFPGEITAEDLTWSAPDIAAFDAQCAVLRAELAKADNAQNVAQAYYDLYVLVLYYGNQYTLCTIDYYRDPNTYSQSLQDWESFLVTLSNEYQTVSKEAFQSEAYSAIMTATFGQSYADSVLNAVNESEEQQKLLAQESALEDSYYTEMGKSTVDVTAVETIMMDLVTVRNAYAASKGFDSYADYAYSVLYYRDYTADEAAQLGEYVKQYVVPMIDDLRLPLTYNSSLGTDKLSTLSNLSESQVVDIVGSYIDRVSSEYADVYDYMVEHHLYDLAASDTKADLAFTVDLPYLGSAFIFDKPNGAYDDVQTLTHEFGHFAALCLSDYLCQDVAEIHSQGLEALYMSFADEMAGEGGDAYCAYSIYSLLSSVSQGCLFDEFQRALYETDDLTVEKANALFLSIAEDYGLTPANNGITAYSWISVGHNFSDPFYYISYATSALSALELLGRSADDFNAAADDYLALTAMSTIGSYKAVTKAAGLSDIFQSGSVQKIAADVSDYLDSEVYDLAAFSDLSGHWSEDAAKLCAACGMFQGDNNGNFLPDSDVTRGAFVTVLWRLLGEGSGRTANFTDVQSGDWYSGAVNWAYAYGIADGTSDSEFTPNGSLTREQLAVMLYRMLDEPTVKNSNILNSYSDVGEVSSWAKDAMAWSVENGLITGKNGNLLAPGGTATRAETATIMARLIA
ncbi:MAG: S-layer homology domain-containing protein [Oscillospiraceae bacterium]|nr:S-layer homology domain-containing protein [Oscillospiraceae bacterium]